MALTTHINTTSIDLPLNSSGVTFVEFSEGNDKLIFTAGNTEVQDGADIPSQAELVSAGVILTGAQIVVDDYLLEDVSDNLLKSINNMGNVDKQYILAFDFDASTASEPVFEVWDDDQLNSATGAILGSGTPSSSFVRGVTTTTSSPGANWITTGTRMAGSSDGNFLYLNDQNGFLTGTSVLYCNLCIVIPASQTSGFSSSPVGVIKWLEN